LILDPGYGGAERGYGEADMEERICAGECLNRKIW